MYDPKFEKAIQQKMEELEFRPPESVWVNIEKAVVIKRRRKAVFFWRYVLPVALVVAAAGFYWRHESKATHPGAGSNTGGSLATRSRGGLDAATGGTPNGATTGAHGTATDATVTPNGATGGTATTDALTGRNMQARHSSGDLSGVSAAFSRQAGRKRVTGRKESDGNADETPNATAEGTDGQTVMAGGAALAGRPQAAEQSRAGRQTQTSAPKGPEAWFYLPGLADQRLAPQIRASAMGTKNVAMAGLSHPRRQWEAGFVAGGGLSRLNRLNSDQARVALAAGSASFYTISNASSGSHYISNVRPEASFEGGIYLQRALSDRWIFNTGMNLHYYSNRISVGQQVTTYVQSSYSYLAPTVQTAATTSMYSAGDTRSVINKYYFLELPVGLQWKINKSRLLPIFVEGGVSLSRLMGASALFYNAKTGLYSKDGDIVNKTQFNIESALLVGLPFHGVNIQLGPQIQYGLTPLANTQGVGDQHLLYTGIRLVVIPGRK